MLKSIKYVIITGVVLALLITADYYLIKKNPDVLNLSMSMLGEKFKELVPEGGEAISRLFDQFAKKVEAQEIDPDDVEQIAANILNLRNQNATLTPEQAQSVISVAFLKPKFEVNLLPDSIQAPPPVVSPEEMQEIDIEAIVVSRRLPRKIIDPERYVRLGERLKDVFEMNDKIQREMRIKLEPHDLNKHFRFLSEDGIKLIIDTEIKQVIFKIESRQLYKEIQNLEKRQMLVWRENMAEEMRKDLKVKESQLQELAEFKNTHWERIKELRIENVLRSLEHLKKLETMGYRPLFNSDSIRVAIEIKIKEVQQEKELQKDEEKDKK